MKVKSSNINYLLSMLFSLVFTQQIYAKPLYGFVPFPYDLSQQAVDYSYQFAQDNSSLFIQHYDDCVPWQEILSGDPIPAWLQAQWQKAKDNLKASQKTYVAITPTKQDRHTMAYGCGDLEGQTIDPPQALVDAGFNSEEVQYIWQLYVEKVVAFFEPDYLNIGIEINSLLWLFPDDWPAMEQLLLSSYHQTKINHPTIQVGVEAILQNLMLPEVANGFQTVADSVDFLGISFYPYASSFFEVYGMPPAPQPPSQWQQPLNWLSTYTKTPLAIAETGYTTETNTVNIGDGLVFPGNEQLQHDYLIDLMHFARWDNYQFVIWFVPIDYDLLSQALGDDIGSDAPIWEDTGLIEFDLTPKPAFAEWQKWSEYSIGKNVSGSWYTPGQSGHGFSIELISWNRMILYWYTYDQQGQQIWLLGDGSFSQDKAQLSLFKTEGMRFGSFLETDLQSHQWGTMEIKFNDCGHAQINWETNEPGFSGGQQAIEQIVPVSGLSCQ